MFKSAKTFKRLGASLFIMAIAFIGVFYVIEQSRQRRIQVGILNNSFTKVQPQNGGVLFVPSHRGLPMQLQNPSASYFEKPTVLSVGSKFRKGDEHFLLQYTVSRIERDGVTIDYETEGGEPSSIRRSHGSIKLSWK